MKTRMRMGLLSLACLLFSATGGAQDDVDLDPDFDETLVVDSIMKFNFTVGTTYREWHTRFSGRGSPAAQRFASRIPRSRDSARGLGPRATVDQRRYDNGEIICEPTDDEEYYYYYDEYDGDNPPPPGNVVIIDDGCFLIPSGGERSRDGSSVSFKQEGRSVSVQDPGPADFGFGEQDRSLGSVDGEQYGQEITFEFGPINLFLRPFGINRQDIRIYIMGRISRNTFEETIRATTFNQTFTLRRTVTTDTFPLNDFGDFTGQPGERDTRVTSSQTISENNQLIQDIDFESFVFTLGPAVHYDPEWLDGLYFVFEVYAGVAHAEAEASVVDILFRDVNGNRSEVGRVEFEETDSDWSFVTGFNFHTRIQFSHVFIGVYTGLEYMENLTVDVGIFSSEISQSSWRHGAYIGWGI